MNEATFVTETASRIIQYNSALSRAEMKRIWTIATIFGAIWGTLEITLGAFIHNLRIPFGGMLLTTIAAFQLTLVARLYPIKGLLVRVGLIASLCKSLSPGGLILTPMIAIFMEALLAEIVYSTVGVNALGAALTGILLPLWSFFQKVFGSIIFYGGGLIEIYVKLVESSAGILHAPPMVLVWGMVGILALFGMCGSIGALLFFQTKSEMILDLRDYSLPESVTAPSLKVRSGERPKKIFAALFLSFLSLCFAFQFSGQLVFALTALLALVALVYALERQIFFKFIKPKFWIFAFIIVSLSGLFLGKDYIYIGGIRFSPHGFLEGCSMLIRAATIYLLVLSFSRLFDSKDFNRIFKKLGQEQMGPVLKRSFDLLPQFISIYRDELERRKKFGGRWLGNFMASVLSTAISLINEKGLQIIAITGNVETGKTASALEIIKNLEESGIEYKAVIQPRILDEQSHTTGYKLLLLPLRKELPLAIKNKGKMGYQFDSRAFRAAGKFLRSAPHPHIFIVDEFGKLELKRGGHFKYAFSIMQTYGGVWIITMREEYVRDFEKKLRVKFRQILSIV